LRVAGVIEQTYWKGRKDRLKKKELFFACPKMDEIGHHS
jgi:uncharacterized protein (DUF1919 family)